ncbi:MAG: porphobilinogen synthase [Myxococcales bacterium]|nr:porphobilinogen synthase [Myxococcales bacterium]
MQFPELRMRRLRRTKTMRRLVQEVVLTTNDLVYPLFVIPGHMQKHPIGSLKNQFHLSPDEALTVCKQVWDLGIGSVILFGLPEHKDSMGTDSHSTNGPVQQTIRLIKQQIPDMVVMTDVCLCQYTDHGHCGVLSEQSGVIRNDESLALLGQMALSHAEAGADVVAPSDMMDGRVAAIRDTLDDAGLTDVAILAYSAKFASAYYGPFREAAHSAPQSGDRKTYQMAPPNAREALREVALDIQEGADMVMVKPAMPYLDILVRMRQEFDLPLAAYNVSGEYAMLCAAADAGLIDYRQAMLESLVAIKRAGADLILTYFAIDAAKTLHQGGAFVF